MHRTERHQVLPKHLFAAIRREKPQIEVLRIVVESAAMDVAGVDVRLVTRPEGLTADEAAARLADYGPNVLAKDGSPEGAVAGDGAAPVTGPKSESSFGRIAARKALKIAMTSIISWVSAPATGDNRPPLVRPIPITLRAMPPMALWRAIRRMRRLMCMNSAQLTITN